MVFVGTLGVNAIQCFLFRLPLFIGQRLIAVDLMESFSYVGKNKQRLVFGRKKVTPHIGQIDRVFLFVDDEEEFLIQLMHPLFAQQVALHILCESPRSAFFEQSHQPFIFRHPALHS